MTKSVEISWRAELERAATETGLSDFGGEGFHDALEAFTLAINGDRRLSLATRDGIRGLINSLLVKRLQLYRDRKGRQQIAAQEIRAPLIVVGMPRSGTTFLHALLAQDPRTRSPLTWEVEDPSPPPRAETALTDPRLIACQARMEQIPLEMQRMHISGALLPQECNAMVMLSFQSSNFSAMAEIPSYVEWYLAADDANPYEAHRHFLQQLQAFAPKSWWVLKSPPHMFHMARLIQTYPDARIVFTHRDPAATLPSLASLIAYVRSSTYDQVDNQAVGREMAAFWRVALERAMALRSRERGDGRFVDIPFELISAKPLGAVEIIYDHFGIAFTDEARVAMQRFVDDQPKDKHGAHRYTLQEFGLNKAEVHDQYADYLTRYNVARI